MMGIRVLGLRTWPSPQGPCSPPHAISCTALHRPVHSPRFPTDRKSSFGTSERTLGPETGERATTRRLKQSLNPDLLGTDAPVWVGVTMP